MNSKVTVVTVNNYKYTGEIEDINKSSLFKVQWIKLKTKTKVFLLNTDHIVTLIYADKD